MRSEADETERLL